MRKTRGIVMTSVIASVASVMFAQARTVDFTSDAVGQPPKGFEFGYTANVGRPGHWIVESDSSNQVLTQRDTDSTRARFALAVLPDVLSADVDLSVRIRPISGVVDQAGGLVWRYQNQDNYYLGRANALEDNVVLYKVEGGKRTDLPLKNEGRTYGKKIEVPAGQWSLLRVVAAGKVFEVYFDGTRLYEVEDTTFPQAGSVGLWTKADSVTQFDDFTIVRK
jgi:hypothetical protein